MARNIIAPYKPTRSSTPFPRARDNRCSPVTTNQSIAHGALGPSLCESVHPWRTHGAHPLNLRDTQSSVHSVVWSPAFSDVPPRL